MGRHRGGTRRELARVAGGLVLAGAFAALAVGGAAPLAGASPSSPTTATYFSKQWGLTQINVPAAWQYGTGSGVKIGIVDTGVDLSHPDLAGKVTASATCINTSGNPAECVTSAGAGQDDNGHGTHVAGIAAGAGDGIAGVAPGASLVVAKVLDSSGSGSTADVSAGIAWVVEHGAKVVNLSLGSDPGFLGLNCAVGDCNSSTITDAVEAAWQAGAIPVIAAGNNAGALFGPAGYGSLDAVVVAATGPTGQFASDYSSTDQNAKWGVLAPGGDDPNGPTTPTCGAFDPTEILSSYWDNGSCYATDEGTSMATPFVSGTLALLLGRGLDQQQAVQTLLSTLNTSVTCGAGQGCQGLVNAGAAMAAAARGGGPTTGSPSPAIGAPAGSRNGSAGSTAVGTQAGTATAASSDGTAASSTTDTTSSSVRPATASGSGGAANASSTRSASGVVHGQPTGDALWIVLYVAVGLCIAAASAFVVRRRLVPRTVKDPHRPET